MFTKMYYHIQSLFTITEGIDRYTTSYTFTIGHADSGFESSELTAITPSSSCNGGVCNFVFENISSELLSFPQLMLTVFASNIFGDSLTFPLFIGMLLVINFYTLAM